MATEQTQTSPKKILIATLITLVIAVIVLVTTVLPAEFNLDPLKTGKLLGIAGMSEEQLVGALNRQDLPYQQDTYKTTLAPFERFEYKYRLEQGGTLLFDWQATGELIFDLHSEKDGVDPQKYSPSFDQRQSSGEKGSYTALFPGIHGWYFENRSINEVELTLNTVGFYSQSTEFREGFENHREFD
jgi:hypothetical protein